MLRKTKRTDYEVGYGRPPAHTQFKKGLSGNPKGRPKRRPTSINSVFHQELNRMLAVNENGRRRTITTGEALVRQLLTQGVKGDHKAVTTALSVAKIFGYFERQPQKSVIEVTANVPLPAHIKTEEQLRAFNDQPWRNRPRAEIRTKSDGTEEITMLPSSTSEEPTD